ncbi:MAG: winged helix-turn-helix domain-containing protein, partial [Brachybacterium sp.]|nr:winged helix-turn-helix domain-containing protein [Brachybacterium sp.]
TVALPPGTSDVDAAQLADALRGSADRLTSGRRARTRVELDAPLPFTRTRSSRGDLRALPPRRETPAASPLRPRPGAVVSPTSPARQDAEAARLRALRATAVSPQTPTGAQDSALVVDLYGRRVRIDGEDVDLTYKEFELLAHLARNPRRIIDRGELMGTVWADAGPETGERTVDVHVRRVRTKLGRYRRLISTIRGAGYRLDLGSDVAVLG